MASVFLEERQVLIVALEESPKTAYLIDILQDENAKNECVCEEIDKRIISGCVPLSQASMKMMVVTNEPMPYKESPKMRQ